MFKFLHCLLIYQYRFWRDSCLWIYFVKSNITVFWITFPVDLSLTLWLLLTLQVKYIPFEGSYMVFYFIFWVLFFLVQNVLVDDWFMLWMINISFLSLKWKSLESRFFTLHWSFWPVEFLSTGKTMHPLVLSIGLLLCLCLVCVCVCVFFLNIRYNKSFLRTPPPQYSFNPVWVHELYFPNTCQKKKKGHKIT